MEDEVLTGRLMCAPNDPNNDLKQTHWGREETDEVAMTSLL